MAISPLTSGKNKWIFIGCFLLIGLMQYFVLRRFDFDEKNAGFDALATTAVLAGEVMVIIITFSVYKPQHFSLLYLILFSLILSFLGTHTSAFILRSFLIPDENYTHFIDNSFLIRWFFSIPVTISGALMSIIWYNSEEVKEKEERRKETEIMTKEAELYKLRQQLQPHFLFNSLNSISALTVIDPEKAREMVYQLSEFLRGTLKNEDSKWVKLDEEFRHLELYLEIEKLRFGHRLEAAFEHEPDALKAILPPMVLQPLVENAIKFGLYDTLGKVEINIKAGADANYLYLSVSNPFDPQTASGKGTGFGLKSLRRRLYLLYGRNDLLDAVPEGNIYLIKLKIPQYDQGINN